MDDSKGGGDIALALDGSGIDSSGIRGEGGGGA